MKDPIVEEVRRARMEHTRECNSDLALILEDVRAIQARCGHKVVRLSPKKLTPAAKSNTVSDWAG